MSIEQLLYESLDDDSKFVFDMMGMDPYRNLRMDETSGDYECDYCNRNFADENKLRIHSQIHLPLQHDCFECFRQFRKYADMIAHIECGYHSIDAKDLNQSAAMCYQWKKYMDPSYREDMLEMKGEYGRGWNHEGKPWKCPTCGKWCKKLSSLFEHVWGAHGADAEDQGAMGKLKRWLWNRHG